MLQGTQKNWPTAARYRHDARPFELKKLWRRSAKTAARGAVASC